MLVWDRKMCGFLDIVFDKGFKVGEVGEMAYFVGFGGWFGCVGIEWRESDNIGDGGRLFIRYANVYIRYFDKFEGEILSLCVGELAYGSTRNTNIRSSLNHPAHFNTLKHYCEVTVNVHFTATCMAMKTMWCSIDNWIYSFENYVYTGTIWNDWVNI